MSHANTKDGLAPLVQSLAQVNSGFHAVLRVSWAVGEEQAIELVANGVEVVVPGKDGDRGTAADETTEDVGFGTEVEHGDLDVAGGVQFVGSGGGDLVNEVFLGRVPVFVLLGRREGDIVSNGDASEGGSLVTEKAGNGAGINSSDSGHIVALAPLCERFDGGVVRVAFSDVTDDHAGTLDAFRLEDDSDVLRIERSFVEGNTVVPDQWGGEDEDLSSVGRVGHRFIVCIQV